jgi:hypothetical protein
MTPAWTRIARRPFRLGLLRWLLTPRRTPQSIQRLPEALRRDVGLPPR